MRIAIITENFLPKVDGVTRTLARLLEHLQDGGHQVLLLGPESGQPEYAGAALLGTAGIPFLPYPELKLNLWRPTFTQRLIEFEPDVIHLVDPVWLGAAGLAACRYYLPNTPLVSSYHTNLATYCGHFGWGFFTPLMWRWNRFCHSYCSYVACPSKSTSRMLISQGFEHNVRIWPRGVDTVMFAPSRRSRTLRAQWMGLEESQANSKAVILYVGRVSFEKNLDLVIQAYKEMNHQRCHLVIVGHGPAFDAIQSECAQTNTPVTFTGYLQGIQLAAAYASADIFAFPSVTETFGQVVLEAMASGLPVAGLRAEGVRDLVDHGRTGTLLDVRNLSRAQQVTKYQQHLMTLVQSPETRFRMSREALDKAKRYTWWEAMEAMVRTYRDAVFAANPYYGKDEASTVDYHSSDSGVEEDFAPIATSCGSYSSIPVASPSK
ncbi:glycosyl transferase group 1 [Fennellomyces sp. T-0311]|nr:glycosyl transferase group 1 [Fennellomyces sp. T-0311]